MLSRKSSSTDTRVTAEEGVVRQTVTEKDLEKWEVAQLNGDIGPCSRPSEMFGELARKRQTRHENLMRQLKEDMQAVNSKLEKNVKLSSKELKAHMQYFRDKLQDVLQDVDVSEVTSFDNSVFLQIHIKANEYKSEQQKLIDELYNDLIVLENGRALENRKLLQTACEEMTRIGHLLPYEIQTFVESEVLALNQLSLSNRRNYEDLKLTLTLITEQKFKSFLDKLECIKEEWLQRKLEEAFANLRQDAEDQLSRTVSECYMRLELKGQELVMELSPDANYNTCKAEEWSRNVQSTVAVLETCGKELIDIHKELLKGVFGNFEQQAEDIKSKLTLIQSVDIQERLIKPIVFDKQKELEELEMYWQDSLADIRVQLKGLNQFLLDLGKLWDRHSERLCESQRLIAQALNKADESDQSVIQDLEVKLNIALDTLRQEHNRNELKKCYEVAAAILNSIKAKYESMYLNDVTIIEDYYKMMALEADVLSAEFKEFIYELHSVDAVRVLHCYGEPYRTQSGGTQIVKAIASCVHQIKAVQQWKFGIWSGLSALSEQTKEILQPKAEEWVERRIESLADKKTLQLEIVEKRFDRIKMEIFEKRLQEIETHEELLDKHKKKIEFAYKQLKDSLDTLTEKESEKLNEVKAELDESEDKAKQEDRPGVVRGKQIMIDFFKREGARSVIPVRIPKIQKSTTVRKEMNASLAQRNKEECEERIKSSFEKFRADCDSKIYDLKQANINLMKSIKLFHEGGNYSSEEGKTYATTLEGIDKGLSTELKNFVKESSKKESELAKKISAIFVPPIALFSLLYEETSFNWEIQERCQFFQTEMCETANALESDLDLLKKQIVCFSKLIDQRKKPLHETLYRFWNSLLRLLYANVTSLFFPMEFPETPEPSVVEEEEEDSVQGEFFISGPCCCDAKLPVKLTNSRTFTNKSTEPDENFSCKDFKHELFGSETAPERDATFMGTVQHQLWWAMDSFQKAACTFYKKLQGRKIIRTDLIPPTYEALIKDILVRLKSYNNQFELLWLRVVLDFLPVLGRMKSVANSYVERELNDYDCTVQAALKTFEDDFIACLEYQLTECRLEFEDLNKKLLTLHGYPQNLDLLGSLEEEVIKRTAGLGLSWESAIKKFKSHIKCFRIHHVNEKSEIRKIKVQYSKLKDVLFINELGEDLLDTVIGYCNGGGFCPKDKLDDPAVVSARLKSKTTDPTNKDALKKYDLGLNRDDKRTTSEWYLNQLRDLVERERFTGERPNEFPPCPEGSLDSCQSEDFCITLCASPFHILLKIIDFDGYSGEILKRLNSYLARLKAFAVSQENVHEENLFKWLNQWKLNVKKVRQIYHVKSHDKPETGKETTRPETENNKPKTEKTSASETLTLPKLCPETKLEFKNTTSNIPKLKSRLIESKSISNENPDRHCSVKNLPINFYKSKLLNFPNSSKVRQLQNSSSITLSTKDHHSQIPLLKRYSLSSLTMSPPLTRFPSPLKKNSPKDKQNKVKIISFEQDTKKSTKDRNSRSPSPPKLDAPSNFKKTKPRPSSPTTSNSRSPDKTNKRGDVTSMTSSPRLNLTAKKKSKVKLLSSTKLDLVKESIGRSSPAEETNAIVLKQSSQPSLSKSEKIIQPQEKISLDHLKNEAYNKDHKLMSIEKVHVCIEKKEVETSSIGERKRSYLLTYSTEDLRNDDNISLSFIKNLSRSTLQTLSKDGDPEGLSEGDSKSVIRTLSGHELILTPSMELQLDKAEIGYDEEEISKLLDESEGRFETQLKEIQIAQDEASEYDSEVSTDGELARMSSSKQHVASRVASYKDVQRKTSSSFWKNRGSELLNDVDYRQSVYHPAVSRRQVDERDDLEFRPKSKSIENNVEYLKKSTDAVVRSRSHILKNYATEKLGSSSSERSWATPFDAIDGKASYTAVIKNPPLYDVKRVRTNKERISGALLHFTLKIIRLLAIFNFWPGDNCYILTSHSLRFAR